MTVDDLQITHHLPEKGDQVYIKEVLLPAGHWMQLHKHTFIHKSVLAAGRIKLTLGDTVRVLTAPQVITVPAGTTHDVEALEDTLWLCIHHTNVTDPEAIDFELVDRSKE